MAHLSGHGARAVWTAFLATPTRLARQLGTTPRLCAKVVPKNLKGKGKPAQDYLNWHLNDPYVRKSRYDNYRARSAYKLLEIDDKFALFHPGMTVIDCGAAPGSWTQVLVKRVNADGKTKGARKGVVCPRGTVISLDVVPFEPVPDAICLSQLDILSNECNRKLEAMLSFDEASLVSSDDRVGKTSNAETTTEPPVADAPVTPQSRRFVDAVLSDMAPSATGNRDIDHQNNVNLCYAALRLAIEHLDLGGVFLCKLWNGPCTQRLVDDLGKLFEQVNYAKPDASRGDSAEIYLLARNFKGVRRDQEKTKSES